MASFALALLSALPATVLAVQPPRTGAVAAVFPPWWSGPQAMMAAATAGRIVRQGALPFVVVVMPDAANAPRALRQAGAWMVADPRAAGGCTNIANGELRG